ncbi:serine/threonine dehydratase [Streptomyces sp. NPDC006510]|uniref:serine/threonine dehydratase n=1 Tax=Streptomyces sp. NPDC006510 TaxID=3155600 RepID=UPI0033A70C7B
MTGRLPLTYADIAAAAARIEGRVRPALVAPAAPTLLAATAILGGPGAEPTAGTSTQGPHHGAGGPRTWLVLEHLQHTGSFKARGMANLLSAHQEQGTLPGAGVAIASGGNAGVACAWAARAVGTHATVFLPASAPAAKADRLGAFGAEVRFVEGEYADAAAACAHYAERSGALLGHAYDNTYVAAGAGTLLEEIRDRIPGLDTVIVAAGGGGLLAGTATAAHHHGIRTVAVEPEHSRAVQAAIAADRLVDVPVDSIAADALGARRATELALHAARATALHSVLVPDRAITAARQWLWDEWRIAAEHSGATALSALSAPALDHAYGYRPAPGETVAVVVCGANTDPADLTRGVPA